MKRTKQGNDNNDGCMTVLEGTSLEGRGDEFIQTGDRVCAESSGKQRAHEVGNNAKVGLSLVVREETRQ
ncbi:hypothetical protein STEG23_024812, partial [Scotinomys teguina]